MKLYLVRHGIAVPHGMAGMAEDERPLTEEGIKKLNLSAPGLRSLGCTPDIPGNMRAAGAVGSERASV
jgi:phosphohistidine phosphatase SixA